MNSLRLPRRSRLFAVIAASLLGVAVITGVAAQLNEDAKDTSRQDPASKLPQDERAVAERTVMANAQDAQAAFRKEFIARGRGIHDLPLVDMEPQVLVLPTLESAVESSILVVSGTIIEQRAVEEGVISVLKVADVVAGASAESQIIVRQPGGPFLNGDTPILLQWKSDPLLAIDHTYVLFLSECQNPPAPGALCMNGSPTQLEVIGGVLATRASDVWTDDWAGRTFTDLRATVTSAASR